MISDFWMFCALQGKQVVFGIILELKIRRRRKQTETSRHSRVVTSQRPYIWSTKKKSTNVSTSRLHHGFCLKNLKKQRGPNFEIIEERKEESTKKKETVTGVIGRDSRFLFFFSHKLLMIY